jgi:spore coat polysaccharide biosynthesis protein SpsF
LVATIIQARMGSERLPGKVLADLAGRPMLEWVIRRAAQSQVAERVVVATTNHAADDAIVGLCGELNTPVHRGPDHDVLTRYVQAAEAIAATVIVRVTADCPFVHPGCIDAAARLVVDGAASYAGTGVQAGWPRGLDVEAFSSETLRAADAEDREPRTREHVTPFIHKHPDRFPARRLEPPPELNRPALRLCVDESADLELVRTVLERLKPREPESLDVRDVVDLLDREPDVAAINAAVTQRTL